MQIGELFILRISVHLNGAVLDTPELFWVKPQLEPVYKAMRDYLEMDQRARLLTDRLDVIADLLAVLKDHRSHGNGEKLEWIGMHARLVGSQPYPFSCRPGSACTFANSQSSTVIILIAVEILVAAINIVVDLYAGI